MLFVQQGQRRHCCTARHVDGMEPRHRAAQGHNGLCGAKRRAAPAKMRKADSKLVSTPEENAGVSARTALRETVLAIIIGVP